MIYRYHEATKDDTKNFNLGTNSGLADIHEPVASATQAPLSVTHGERSLRSEDKSTTEYCITVWSHLPSADFDEISLLIYSTNSILFNVLGALTV